MKTQIDKSKKLRAIDFLSETPTFIQILERVVRSKEFQKVYRRECEKSFGKSPTNNGKERKV